MDREDRAAAELLRMAGAAWVAQAISVAARLGVADFMADGPRAVDDLAAATATHSRSLRRLLRALAGVGVFAEDEQGRFGLGLLGSALRSDAPGSVRALCAMRGEPWCWNAWSELFHTLKTGETAFQYMHGTDWFGFLSQHPETAALFDQAMGDLSRTETDSVVAAYDFGRFKTIVDVGGGRGTLLAAILRANPTVEGTLLDLPATVVEAGALLEKAGVAERCTIAGGSFFEAVPGGAELYVLKSVIHDWDDDRAVAILRACRPAMGNTGRLLLVERLIPPGNGPSFAKMMDLNMLALAGGLERTEAEYRALFARADLELAGVIATGADVSIIEAAPSNALAAEPPTVGGASAE